MTWILYSKGNNYSQYLKVFWWPIGSDVEQLVIPKGYDNTNVSKDTNGVVQYRDNTDWIKEYGNILE